MADFNEASLRPTQNCTRIRYLNAEISRPQASTGQLQTGDKFAFPLNLACIPILNFVVCIPSIFKQHFFYFQSNDSRSIFDKTCNEIELISGFLLPTKFSIHPLFSGFLDANSRNFAKFSILFLFRFFVLCELKSNGVPGTLASSECETARVNAEKFSH